MKHLIYTLLFISLCSKAFAQKPFNQDPNNANLDFSNDNFSQWNVNWGNRGNSFDSLGIRGNSHTIIQIYGNNWEGMVGQGNLKRVPDGLERVARLGSPSGGGYGDPKSYAMTYDITVNSQYPIFFLQYASIMDRTHGYQNNTHFRYRIKNAANTLLPQPCYGFAMYPNGNTTANNIEFDPPVLINSLPSVATLVYQPWKSLAIDLSAYVGQTLKLEFEHYDCYTGAHGSFTYISAAMRSPYDTFYYCRGVSATTIKPYQPNFYSYQWSTGATTDSLIINNPTDGSTYTCTVGSHNGCNATFTYILKEIKTDADFNFSGGGVCNQIQFYDQSTTNVGEITKWEWTFGDAASGAANNDTVQNPQHIYPGPGDYTVSLTVTDTFGCTNTITKTVSVSPEGTVAEIGLPTPSCINDTLNIEDLTANTSRRTWFIDGVQLDDTTKSLRYAFGQTGSYEIKLIAIGSNGCPDTTSQTLRVFGLPHAAIQVIPFTNAAPVTDPEFQFKGFEENAAKYIWDFGYGAATAEGQYSNFTYPPEIAEYKVLLKTFDQNGCHDTANVYVKVMPPYFMIPNAFSPNGDGRNDVFKIINITNHTIKDFSIYNRYGQRVFYTIHPGKGWDATFNSKPCEVGTYYYLVRYTMPGSDKEYIMKGDVMLIR